MTNLTVGFSPLSKRVYCGKLRTDKQGHTVWAARPEKQDATSAFIRVMLEYINQDGDNYMLVTSGGKRSNLIAAAEYTKESLTKTIENLQSELDGLIAKEE